MTGFLGLLVYLFCIVVCSLFEFPIFVYNMWAEVVELWGVDGLP